MEELGGRRAVSANNYINKGGKLLKSRERRKFKGLSYCSIGKQEKFVIAFLRVFKLEKFNNLILFLSARFFLPASKQFS
jgi:hypothetical protein